MSFILPLVCMIMGIAGVVFSIWIANIVKGSPAGNEKMNEIADAIKTGAVAYLNRQLKSMGIAGIILFIIIAVAPGLGIKTAIGFLIGAAASFIAGYVGMRVSVIANVRTAEAAKGGLAKGLDMAFRIPQSISAAIENNAPEIIVTMGCGEECPFAPGAKMLDWDLPDPSGESTEVMRKVRDEIDKRVKELIGEIS